jgi:hypothetical protein
MPLMCIECYEPKYIKYRSGVYCKKCGGYLVEIDENFLQTIILLNKKGYMTSSCCGGHIRDKSIDEIYSYIQFEGHITLPHLPENYTKSDYNKEYYNRWQISTKIKSDNLVSLQKLLLQNAIKILDWTESLPILEEKDMNLEKIISVIENWKGENLNK